MWLVLTPLLHIPRLLDLGLLLKLHYLMMRQYLAEFQDMMLLTIMVMVASRLYQLEQVLPLPLRLHPASLLAILVPVTMTQLLTLSYS